ncbi:hypothetical protein GCM10010406_49810 [Streptomyces thermolineatus]|uniref:Uncharacterized protein n=1 Tax=Streptomyces thermolineatus TaxID=44033 RepID=A0ABN3MU13_9ACTN
MSEHAQLMAVAGAAAAALVAEMTKASWASARDLVARVFGRGGEQEEQRQLIRLDADRQQVGTVDRAELVGRWQRRLLTLLEDYPEAAEDLAALARRNSADPQARVSQTAAGNTGPVIQVGGDNYGGLNAGSR